MGNKEVLEEVYLLKRPLLLGACARIMGSAAAAEDIVQAVFLKALNHGTRFSDVNHCFGFLCRACRNACIDLARKRSAWKRAQLRIGKEVPQNVPIVGEEVEQYEQEGIRGLSSFSNRAITALNAACAKRDLPLELFLCRGAIVRHARESGIKESTIRSRCKAALAQARKQLGIA